MACMPAKGIAVEPFHQDPKAGSIPLEDLDRCTSAVAEGKHAVGIGIQVEF